MEEQRNDREFAASIRQEVSDDTELRNSLKEFGWVPEFPAIKDEFGAVLVGNRRLKIAAEEGITPVIKTITFGDDNDANAERLKLALVSNLGGALLSLKDRRRIAVHLYQRGWSSQRIGNALNVTRQVIAQDCSRAMVQPMRQA